MTVTYDLIIRNARDMDGTPITVGIVDGRIAALGPAVDGRGAEYDAREHVLGPGLHDHHCHLLATAARLEYASPATTAI